MDKCTSIILKMNAVVYSLQSSNSKFAIAYCMTRISFVLLLQELNGLQLLLYKMQFNRTQNCINSSLRVRLPCCETAKHAVHMQLNNALHYISRSPGVQLHFCEVCGLCSTAVVKVRTVLHRLQGVFSLAPPALRLMQCRMSSSCTRNAIIAVRAQQQYAAHFIKRSTFEA